MRILLTILVLMLPTLATAQGTATLVADDVSVIQNDRLIATGNIEALYDGVRLTASRITYDRTADRLLIDGPIVITEQDGTILTADQASLDPQLENGLLRSARIVLDRQLQLAANQIDRIDGRFSQLYRVAATSCQVCSGQEPLWELRAERIVHDEDAQLLYLTNAQFRIKGVPVIYLPRLRLPDPTLDRATGLLVPRIRPNDNLGTGLKLPYFVALGESRDLLLTPYLSSETTTLELRYRQAFSNGFLSASGATSQDTLLPDETRSYLFIEGLFDLPRDFRLAFDIEAASDLSYLSDYGYSDKDRLDSSLAIARARDDDLFVADLTYYETLRENEVNASLPPVVANLSYDRRIALGEGQLRLGVGADAIERYGDETSDAGRDVRRFGVSADYQRDWITDAGLAVTTRIGGTVDRYQLRDAPAFPANVTRLAPNASVILRFPLSRTLPRSSHLIEPLLAVHWSKVSGGAIPNEDSTRPELDQSNLLSVQHFPGQDARETGLRGAAGMTWTRRGDEGITSTLTFGRIFREDNDPRFTRASGMSGAASDWLIAGQFTLAQGLRVEARSLVADDFDTSLTNARIGWQTDQLDLEAAYIWQAADPGIGREDAISEWSLETAVQATEAWNVRFDARYDIGNDRPARAGVGVEWRNECVSVELSASRRYASSINVAPSTDYGISVALLGFSAGRSGPGPAGSCRTD
jgi:LPS-assembly protein